MRNCDRIYTDKNCNLIIDDEFNNEYVNIYLIEYITAEGVTISLVFLKEKESDIITCTIKKDGHYSICRIDVPLDPLSYFYYKDGKFYKNIQEVSLKEIVLVNPEVSKLHFSYDDYFSTCHLWRCYVKVCLEIFDLRASVKCNAPNIDSTLIYKRDLLNTTLNVIDYMANLEQYSEASRLLERVNGCNGLCNDTTDTKGCGCM